MNAIIKAIMPFFMNIHSVPWYGLLCFGKWHWSTILNFAIWGAIHSPVSVTNIKDGLSPKLNKLNLKQVCVQFNSMLDKQNQAFERVSQRKVSIRFSVCEFDHSNSMQPNSMRSSVSSGIQMRKNWYQRCLCICICVCVCLCQDIHIHIGRLSSSREWLILVRKEKDELFNDMKESLEKAFMKTLHVHVGVKLLRSQMAIQTHKLLPVWFN